MSRTYLTMDDLRDRIGRINERFEGQRFTLDIETGHDSSCIGRVCLNPEHADEEAAVIDVSVIAPGGIPQRGDVTAMCVVDSIRQRMQDTREARRK